MMRYIDLCCGIGSFHYSFRQLGWECVLAADINEDARKTYETNYGIKPEGDLCSLDIPTIPHHDVLCAGFPCQPFSLAGQHGGFEDTRGTLFFEIMKIVSHHKPTWVVFENVPALLTHDGGKTFTTIQNALREQGYRIAHTLLVCKDYGIPQLRKRLFLVGTRRDMDPATLLDMSRNRQTCTLSQFLGKPFEREVAYTLRCGGRHSPLKNKHNWDGYVVDGKEYRLSIVDGLRLQGFPSDFKLSGSQTSQWKQLGNTIPTVFTRMIATNLAEWVQCHPE